MDARRLTHHHLMEVPSPVCTTAVGNSHATIALLVLLLVLVTVIVELVKSRNSAKLGERKWPERTENLRPMWCRPRDYVYGHKSIALAAGQLQARTCYATLPHLMLLLVLTTIV